MNQAVLPFLEYVVLQVFAALAGLNVVQDKEIGITGVIKTWIFGQMLLFAVLQIMAVPMILLRWKFDILFWSYLAVCIALIGTGTWRAIRKKTRIKIRLPELKPLETLLLMVAVLLVLWQAGNYFFGMHLDEDDARWLAEANDAIEYGDLMTRHYQTGEYIASFWMYEDATSPWPMMYAVFSGILRTRVSIFAHTVFAPIELLLMYGVYWMMGRSLFKRMEARTAFFFSVVLISLFYGGTVYTQSVFSLIRVWQGKAVVAAVIIPLMFTIFMDIHQGDAILDWARAAVVGTAACLMSGMGIFIGAIMTAVYGIYDIIAYRRWRRIPVWGCAALPPILFLFAHWYIKG